MVVMALGLFSQTAAKAGGGSGGSKNKNATITVYNTQNPAVNDAELVIFLASGKKVPDSFPAYAQAGAQMVNPGPVPVIFSVPPGTGTILVPNIYFPQNPLSVSSFPYTVSSGKSYVYTLGGDNKNPTMTLK